MALYTVDLEKVEPGILMSQYSYFIDAGLPHQYCISLLL
jgi:hypothetical protein